MIRRILSQATTAFLLLSLMFAGFATAQESTKQQEKKAAEVVVYVTKNGTKYHRASCRHLKSKIPMSLKEAKQRYDPCKVCLPPE